MSPARQTFWRAYERADDAAAQPRVDDKAGGWLRSLTAGGAEGNEQLTAITGLILIVLLVVIAATILLIRQLISIHLFVGLLLLGPVALKMASTGYRFIRYYTRDPVYRSKGPPELALRLIAPVVMLTTVACSSRGSCCCSSVRPTVAHPC